MNEMTTKELEMLSALLAKFRDMAEDQEAFEKRDDMLFDVQFELDTRE